MSGESTYLAQFTSVIDLEERGEGVYRSARNDANDNGRVYGGQLLAQAVAAALRTVPEDRPATVLQALFLAGAKPEAPIDYSVTALQNGRRFSSRQVTARQGDVGIVSAHVSFQVEATAPGHDQPMDASAGTPEAARPLSDIAEALTSRLGTSGYLGLFAHPYIECRFVDPVRDLLPTGPGHSIRFWIRIGQPLAHDPGLHSCALAYLSDWWLSYASVSPHLGNTSYDGFYVASLNHNLWFHAPWRADEWGYCVIESPWAGSTRGLSFGRLYRRDGVLAASMVQEVLQSLKSG